jgi:hypothetical protein
VDDNYKALLLVLAALDRAESSKIASLEDLKKEADYWLVLARSQIKTDNWCPACKRYGYHEYYCG